eukprot:361763-Pyramimonas_sp.AAC.1
MHLTTPLQYTTRPSPRSESGRYHSSGTMWSFSPCVSAPLCSPGRLVLRKLSFVDEIPYLFARLGEPGVIDNVIH